MKKYIFKCLFLSLIIVVNFYPGVLKAQLVSMHSPQISFLYEDSLLQNPLYHSALIPVQIGSEDLGTTKKNHKGLFAAPVFDAILEKYQNEFSHTFGEGLYVAGNLGAKAGFEFSGTFYQQQFPGGSYSIDSLKIVPRNNHYLWGGREEAGYISLRGNVYWKPNRWLTLKAGNDKNFIGDGIRSFFLSENAAAYPFAQLRLNIWKINYAYQFMLLSDVVPGLKDMRFEKYASMHTISVNATRKINFYVFEAVVWRKQDSIRHRGVDVNYLNPFLFFRPVEFNMGSPDNVLMGIGGKWILGKSSFFFGQLLLDEFKLKEIKANKGWWSNKYAFQTGFRTYAIFKRHPSVFSIEYNHCRPFTYSHTNTLENYGYLDQSLAHPEQSNFKEVISAFRVQLKKQWFFTLTGQYLLKGTDPEGLNYGSDMYKKLYTYSKLYGNETGQGIQRNTLTTEIMLSRTLKPEWRMQAFVSTVLTKQSFNGISSFHPVFSLGIHTLIYE